MPPEQPGIPDISSIDPGTHPPAPTPEDLWAAQQAQAAVQQTTVEDPPAPPPEPPAAAPQPPPPPPPIPEPPAPAVAPESTAPAPPPPPAPETLPAGVAPPNSSPAGTVGMPAAPAAAPAAPAQVIPAEWPFIGYDGVQPWQADNPPELTHDRGFVTSGSTGDLVVELCAILAHLGYGTAISSGTNPHAIYGPSEVAAVDAFRRDYGVQEDPKIVAATMPSVVGPWTWEALFRALYKVVRAPEAEVE